MRDTDSTLSTDCLYISKIFSGTPIPNWMLRRTDVKPSIKVVYGEMTRLAKNGTCFASLDTIGCNLGLAVSTVYRSIQWLLRAGFVERAGRRGASTVYKFLWREEIRDSLLPQHSVTQFELGKPFSPWGMCWYTEVPFWVLRDADYTVADALVYGSIVNRARNGRCRMTQRDVEVWCGLSARVVRAAMRRLQSDGLIARTSSRARSVHVRWSQKMLSLLRDMPIETVSQIPIVRDVQPADPASVYRSGADMLVQKKGDSDHRDNKRKTSETFSFGEVSEEDKTDKTDKTGRSVLDPQGGEDQDEEQARFNHQLRTALQLPQDVSLADVGRGLAFLSKLPILLGIADKVQRGELELHESGVQMLINLMLGRQPQRLAVEEVSKAPVRELTDRDRAIAKYYTNFIQDVRGINVRNKAAYMKAILDKMAKGEFVFDCEEEFTDWVAQFKDPALGFESPVEKLERRDRVGETYDVRDPVCQRLLKIVRDAAWKRNYECGLLYKRLLEDDSKAEDFIDRFIRPHIICVTKDFLRELIVVESTAALHDEIATCELIQVTGLVQLGQYLFGHDTPQYQFEIEAFDKLYAGHVTAHGLQHSSRTAQVESALEAVRTVWRQASRR